MLRLCLENRVSRLGIRKSIYISAFRERASPSTPAFSRKNVEKRSLAQFAKVYVHAYAL